MEILGDDTERHYVDMFNGSEKSHAFAVTVADEDEETIFEHTYDLEPRTGDENRIIEGDPAAFTVAVDDAESVQFSWSPQADDTASSEGCSGGTAASLSIHYQIASDPEIKSSYGCESVTD